MTNTITYLARPEDSRCKWWSALIPIDITEKHLEERIEFNYLRAGSDLELEPGTFLIDCEQIHHRKMRGYRAALGVVLEEGVKFIFPTLEIKKYIKANGGQDLMKGVGDVAGCIRIALFLRRQPNLQESFEQIKDI